MLKKYSVEYIHARLYGLSNYFFAGQYTMIH